MTDSMDLKNQEYQQLSNQLLRIGASGKLYNKMADLERAANYIRNRRDVTFKRVDGFSATWENGHVEQLHNRIENAIAGFWNEGAELIFVINSDGKKNNFYLLFYPSSNSMCCLISFLYPQHTLNYTSP